MNLPERGKFVEVLRQNSDNDKRTHWCRGLIIGVGPGIVVEQGRKYTLGMNELLVKLSNGHAAAETVMTINRLHEGWRLMFR
jgi:hypothetical protein